MNAPYLDAHGKQVNLDGSPSGKQAVLVNMGEENMKPNIEGPHSYKPIVVVLDQKKKKINKAKHFHKCFWPCALFMLKAILLILGYLGYQHWSTDSGDKDPVVSTTTTATTMGTKAIPSVRLSIPDGHACPDDWMYFNMTNQCYKYFKQTWSWKGSETFCVARGAHMVSIHTREENDFVCGMSEIEGVDDNRLSIWLGGYSPNKDNVFVWTDGSPWDFSWFHPAEPNMVGRENCLEIYRCGGSLGVCWNNVECDWHKTGFVCKMDAHGR